MTSTPDNQHLTRLLIWKFRLYYLLPLMLPLSIRSHKFTISTNQSACLGWGDWGEFFGERSRHYPCQSILPKPHDILICRFRIVSLIAKIFQPNQQTTDRPTTQITSLLILNDLSATPEHTISPTIKKHNYKI